MLILRASSQQLSIKLYSQESLVFEEVVDILESLGMTWTAYQSLGDTATADDSDIVFDTIDVYGDAATIAETFDAITEYISDQSDSVTASESWVHSYGLAGISETATASEATPIFNETTVLGDTATIAETPVFVTAYANVESDSVTTSEDVQYVMQYAEKRMINGSTINSQSMG